MVGIKLTRRDSMCPGIPNTARVVARFIDTGGALQYDYIEQYLQTG